jgi:DNA invertase Pin-like site-specific DNA recombinase
MPVPWARQPVFSSRSFSGVSHAFISAVRSHTKGMPDSKEAPAPRKSPVAVIGTASKSSSGSRCKNAQSRQASPCLADVYFGRGQTILLERERIKRATIHRIVDVLDAHNASFVSVTQQFNTTTSMGRLTLNMLLSFAQFEREIAGERIRDKIAASKKKGMWMGGNVPLGYDVKDRKLIVNEPEASTSIAIASCTGSRR